MDYRVELINQYSFWESNIATALISALGVLLSILLTYLVNKKLNEENRKFQEDLNRNSIISQEKIANQNINAGAVKESKLRWLEEIRKLSIEYTETTYSSMTLFHYIAGTHNVDREEDLREKMDKLDSLILKVQSLGYALLLYFPENDRNTEISEKISNIFYNCIKLKNDWFFYKDEEEFDKTKNIIIDNIEELNELLRKRFEEELNSLENIV